MADIESRLEQGKLCPYLDDAFALAILQTKNELRLLYRRKGLILRRPSNVLTEVGELDENIADLVLRLEEQHRLVAKYQQWGELSESEIGLLALKSSGDSVREVMDLFFAPNFKREERVQLWDRLGSLKPVTAVTI